MGRGGAHGDIPFPLVLFLLGLSNGVAERKILIVLIIRIIRLILFWSVEQTQVQYNIPLIVDTLTKGHSTYKYSTNNNYK